MTVETITHTCIESALDNLSALFTETSTAIFVAPPGEGKTTRAPLKLLEAEWLEGRKIVLLEPRRLAAVNAACYMAQQLGEEVGERVGYTIRYERKVSSKTRIEVVTEGILARRLQQDPQLSGVGLVVFDEFHERNLQSDLALALCRDSQQGLREDLRLLVMSATLDAQELSGKLEHCPVVTVSGKRYPVEVEYLASRQANDLAMVTAKGVRHALSQCNEDLLVFLPGAREIRRCRELLEGISGVDIHLLYGDLPFARQQQAIVPGRRQKVILSTNIAETSLTIEGVGGVVDSGFERRPRFNPGTGLSVLETVRISRQSAEQRAGRAGRLGPGRCWRLWSEGVQGGLLPVSPPELLRADLSDVALELAGWGVDDPAGLFWLDPPPAGGFAAAKRLLNQLGAVSDHGVLTRIGRRMLEIPAHPRHARMLVAAQEWDCLEEAILLVSILSENEALRTDGGSDDLSERFLAVRSDSGRGYPRTSRAVRYWRRFFKKPGGNTAGANGKYLGRLLAVAYPDRVTVQGRGTSGQLLLSSGRGCRLRRETLLGGERFLVAPDIVESGRELGEVRWACAVDGEQLSRDLAHLLRDVRRVEYHPASEKIEAWQSTCLLEAPIRKRRVELSEQEREAGLCEAVRKQGLEILDWSESTLQLHARLALLQRLLPEGWPDVSREWLLENLDVWLMPYMHGTRSVRDLKRFDPAEPLISLVAGRERAQLDELVPERVLVPSGSRIRLDYCSGDVPVLAVKLQEMFGCRKTPTIVGGRQSLTVHLLSPAGRPLQVTSDLEHFWREIYPEVRREMRGRYPKHPWPEDPFSAPPTRKTKRRA